MACLTKLNKAIVFGCAGGAIGLSELLLVNKTDIETITITDNEVIALALNSGMKAYAVDCYKNSAKITEAIRTSDAANGMEQTVTVTVYDKTKDGARIVESLLNGNFVAFGKLKDGGTIKVAGALAGLEASAADSDTSANGGFATVALKTPDGGRGDAVAVASTAVWNYLNANKVGG